MLGCSVTFTVVNVQDMFFFLKVVKLLGLLTCGEGGAVQLCCYWELVLGLVNTCAICEHEEMQGIYLITLSE